MKFEEVVTLLESHFKLQLAKIDTLNGKSKKIITLNGKSKQIITLNGKSKKIVHF